MSHTAPGGRTSRRPLHLDTTTVLAVALPVLTVVALFLVHPAGNLVSGQAPTRTALTSASVICPTALNGAPETYLTTAESQAHGSVDVSSGGDARTAEIAAGKARRVRPGTGPVTITGEGDLAPGLVAARFGGRQLAAVSCPATAAAQWFTAVGSGARHNSILELVNPDAGPAVADVLVRGHSGLVDVPRLRGVSVSGHGSVRLDLGAIVPRRDELALQVVTTRGRLSATVLDQFQPLGAKIPNEDWLAAQPEPTTDNLLLGLGKGPGKRSLVLANGGEDEVRAELKLVSEESVFAPAGVAEIRVPPNGVRRVSLSGKALAAVREGAFGVEVTSTAPLTATLRSFVGGDLSHAVAGTPLTSGATLLAPEGTKQVLLGGADAVGVVTVVARTAHGKELLSKRVALQPGKGALLDLPRKAAVISLVPERTGVVAALLLTGRGAAVVPFTETVRSGLVPAVRPGLP